MAANLMPDTPDDTFVVSIPLDDSVQGVITEVVESAGATTMQLRDMQGRDVKLLVKSPDLAQRLSARINQGHVRVAASGIWDRTSAGWLPRNGECEALHMVALKSDSIGDILGRLASIPGAGWSHYPDPMAEWRAHRGCE